ncbi:MAG TPA: NUDIX hydrolase [Pyrinomonadaceae bacterium]
MREVYDNAWIGVREDRVVQPDGDEGVYGVVHFKNTAIGVLAVEDGEVYLVGQYRYPLGQYSWEIPEGGCAVDEEPLAAAKRELEEETGLSASRWQQLGTAHLSNSVTDEYAVWFLAKDLIAGPANPEGSEKISVRRVLFSEALEWVLGGKITDSISRMAIMEYQLKFGGVG